MPENREEKFHPEPASEGCANKEERGSLPQARPEASPLLREGEAWYARSHEDLVQAFRTFIQQREQLSQGALSPAEIIRNKLEQERQTRPFSDEKRNNKRVEFFFQLLGAWDALAYELYEPGTYVEHIAGSMLSMRYQATHEPAIWLSDPTQVRMIDALTKVVATPHKKGQKSSNRTGKSSSLCKMGSIAGLPRPTRQSKIGAGNRQKYSLAMRLSYRTTHRLPLSLLKRWLLIWLALSLISFLSLTS